MSFTIKSFVTHIVIYIIFQVWNIMRKKTANTGNTAENILNVCNGIKIDSRYIIAVENSHFYAQLRKYKLKIN